MPRPLLGYLTDSTTAQVTAVEELAAEAAGIGVDAVRRATTLRDKVDTVRESGERRAGGTAAGREAGEAEAEGEGEGERRGREARERQRQRERDGSGGGWRRAADEEWVRLGEGWERESDGEDDDDDDEEDLGASVVPMPLCGDPQF